MYISVSLYAFFSKTEFFIEPATFNLWAITSKFFGKDYTDYKWYISVAGVQRYPVHSGELRWEC